MHRYLGRRVWLPVAAAMLASALSSRGQEFRRIPPDEIVIPPGFPGKGVGETLLSALARRPQAWSVEQLVFLMEAGSVRLGTYVPIDLEPFESLSEGRLKKKYPALPGWDRVDRICGMSAWSDGERLVATYSQDAREIAAMKIERVGEGVPDERWYYCDWDAMKPHITGALWEQARRRRLNSIDPLWRHPRRPDPAKTVGLPGSGRKEGQRWAAAQAMLVSWTVHAVGPEPGAFPDPVGAFRPAGDRKSVEELIADLESGRLGIGSPVPGEPREGWKAKTVRAKESYVHLAGWESVRRETGVAVWWGHRAPAPGEYEAPDSRIIVKDSLGRRKTDEQGQGSLATLVLYWRDSELIGAVKLQDPPGRAFTPKEKWYFCDWEAMRAHVDAALWDEAKRRGLENIETLARLPAPKAPAE